MSAPSRNANSPFYISLEALEEKLAELSHGAEQWAAVRIDDWDSDEYRDYSSWLLVGYSNPDSTGIPNMICFSLPLAPMLLIPGQEPEWLVCVNSSRTVPVLEGLYWEAGKLLHDGMGDFDLVWDVVHHHFVGDAPVRAEQPGASSERTSIRDQPLGGNSYSEVLASQLEWLKTCRKILVPKIQSWEKSNEILDSLF